VQDTGLFLTQKVYFTIPSAQNSSRQAIRVSHLLTPFSEMIRHTDPVGATEKGTEVRETTSASKVLLCGGLHFRTTNFLLLMLI